MTGSRSIISAVDYDGAQSEFAFCQSAAPSADVVIVIELRHGYLARCHRTKSAG
jgi:hypothetical protein